jgi:hypothetical protein
MKRNVIFMCLFFVMLSISLTSSNSKYIDMECVSVSEIPEDLILSELKSLAVDINGNVFAISVKECFVVKFKSDLKYQTHFGRNGNGPGEFKTRWVPVENRLSIDENGDVYIYDYNPGRLIIFSNNGKYNRDINLQRDFRDTFKGYFSEVRVVGKGTFTAVQDIPGQSIYAVILSLDPSEIKVKVPIQEKRIHVKSGIHYVIGIKETYYGDNYKIVIGSNMVVFADSQKFRFCAYNAKGEKILDVWDKKRLMGSFKSNELKKLEDEFSKLKSQNPVLFNKLIKQLKQRKNVIADIKFSSDKILVFPVRDDITVENEHPVVVYNLKGQIIKKGLFRKIPTVIWRDYAFFLDRNKDDDPVILKYKILFPKKRTK